MNTEQKPKISANTVKEWLPVFTLVGAFLFWIFTIYGIPPRVDRLEKAVAEHEKTLAGYGVKVDVILDDVKVIKGFILQRHGGE